MMLVVRWWVVVGDGSGCADRFVVATVRVVSGIVGILLVLLESASEGSRRSSRAVRSGSRRRVGSEAATAVTRVDRRDVTRVWTGG